jgi:uncharacterized OsmC-like protein
MAGNRSWTIQAISEEGAALAFYRPGEALFVSGTQAAALSPVEHLLIAAAGCLALSCSAVLTDSHGSRTLVEVTAIGSKAPEPPSRLARIDLMVRFGSAIDAVEASSIVEKAEKLCTVTNTLLGSVAIVIDSSGERRDVREGQPAER